MGGVKVLNQIPVLVKKSEYQNVQGCVHGGCRGVPGYRGVGVSGCRG